MTRLLNAATEKFHYQEAMRSNPDDAAAIHGQTGHAFWVGWMASLSSVKNNNATQMWAHICSHGQVSHVMEEARHCFHCIQHATIGILTNIPKQTFNKRQT